jgi:hypothetical protein
MYAAAPPRRHSVAPWTHPAVILGARTGFRLRVIMHVIIRFIACIAETAAENVVALTRRAGPCSAGAPYL